ncbi:MAG: penicillin-binding protein 2, partial [Actinobacteria bacterium]|nr:penicillin-binding protein 2 [Actinomycetota bacterium]
MTPRNHPRSQNRAARAQAKSSSRDWGILVFFVVVACVLVGKLFYVQVVKASEYTEAAKETRTSDIVLSARRGTIYDRNGNVLATSVDATTIYANPQEITDPAACAQQLVTLLGGDVAEYTEKLSREDSSFVYIVRKADVAAAESVQALGLQGIYFLDDSKR